jgi:RNA polymerase sigma-70 factor (ECF subfamily)
MATVVLQPVDDDALVAGMAAADPEAAAAFVRRYRARVYGLARSMLGDAQAAEDVAQEALTKAWRHAGAYDPRRGSVVTWLLAITRNAAIDHLRVRRPEPFDPTLLAALVGPDLDLRSNPADRAAAGDDAGRLQEALRALPVEQRRAIVLAGIGGRTAVEVSDAEGIPLGTAKTRIRTALQRLRVSLATEGLA